MIWSLILQMGSATGGWTLGFLGPLVGLLIMSAIVMVLWSALSRGNSDAGHSQQPNDTLETLRKRYARGDIDEETFEERARTLRVR